MKNKNLKSLDQFIDEQYGAKGSVKRDIFEKGYELFRKLRQVFSHEKT